MNLLLSNGSRLPRFFVLLTALPEFNVNNEFQNKSAAPDSLSLLLLILFRNQGILSYPIINTL
jgi:hypothetical protein